jgi:hypothetical protein
MIRFHAEGEREGPILGAPASLNAKPEELLDDVRAGKLKSLQFSATVFVTGPNRNHFKIPDTELEGLAKSFEGLPFLKDHDESISSVGGRILESQVIAREDGRKAIRQRILATKPWAMEHILDGTIQRFSIGWFAKEQKCSVCNVDFMSSECAHGFRDFGKPDSKTGVPVELMTVGCEGREVSAVVVPAVGDTGIEALMRAKEELMNKNKPSAPPGNSADGTDGQEEGVMSQKILAALGLAEKAEEPEVLAKIEQLKASPPLPVALMTALGLKPEATPDEAIATVVKMTAPDAFVARKDHDELVSKYAKLEAQVTVDDMVAHGKIAPANRDWALKQAVENPAGFKIAFPKDAPRVTALGTEPPPILTEEIKEEIRLSPVAVALGITAEEYAKELAAERALGGR